MTFYATADDAAIAALNDANPLSVLHNAEFRGLIYRTASDAYGYTFPIIGHTYGTSLAGLVTPPGTVEVGHYHTHGAYTGPDPVGRESVRTDADGAWFGAGPFGKPGPVADQFGPEDLPTARERGQGRQGYRSYLGTPSGVFYYYDVDRNAIGELPRRRPRTAAQGGSP